MRKEKQTYFFSVEGETEQWYLEWLQKVINEQADTKYVVKFNSKVQMDPLARVKQMTIIGKTKITHIFDYESAEADHVQRFKTVLDHMRKAEDIGKNITYHLGYSNFTFELWMILHMIDCNGHLSHRRQYLSFLNRAYGEKFKSLNQYKREDNFKRLLEKLTLDHVRKAIERAEAIMRHNKEAGYTLQQYREFSYYEQNPSLSIGEIISQILQDCGLMNI